MRAPEPMPPTDPPARRSVGFWADGRFETCPDVLAEEVPLEIVLEAGSATKRERKNFTSTLRTPGRDEELIVGHLFAEGVIEAADEILSLTPMRPNRWRASLVPGVAVEWAKFERSGVRTAACGACGRRSFLDEIESHPRGNLRVEPALLLELPVRLRTAQDGFDRTGGLHACAIFEPDGTLLALCEDVGRHNALDKLLGWSLNHGRIDWSRLIVVLSGRVGFEMMQKSARAGAGLVAALGAPSSMAVAVAERAGVPLVGFLKAERFNCYFGQDIFSTGSNHGLS